MMLKRQEMRVIIEILAGIVLSAIITAISISIGYFIINKNGYAHFDVNLLGLNLYKIHNHGDSGEPIITNIMFLGVALSILLVIIIELLVATKKRGKKQ
ncbi:MULTISPECIES: LlsX family protein [Staphylococcus]|jgi:ABC-type spermidine/putrescine transport system permease subunit II|nr:MULTISPECIES: LlsX family protein [Staphylococcus]MCH8639984.1 LlsX family protein [Staphylococcus lugdunensis]MCH8652958.1 LlsX family protein [Staphylococcus lugdunensis]MCH8658956.1 LlsX family protein [Staphylococcus lugdunensis]MCH8678128.1 LlsX family protein [Staphylococcus lugdunensis]MCI2225967.1 LlsX family protein [Staphylococcus lugdunensis]